MQFHWSNEDLRGQDDSCEALAPFVMALFDGEASEDQARRARTHLLLCQSCAQRWLDWNRSRDLLQSIPVPAPPPTLMWRVLMACRLAAFAKKGSAKTAAPPAPSFSADSGAPDALRAQILARTTRAATPVTSSVTKSRRPFAVFAVPSMAVPALALWMMVLQRDTLFVSQLPSTVESSETQFSPPPERNDLEPRRERLAVTHLPIKKPVLRHAVTRHVEASDEAEAERPETHANIERPVRETHAEVHTARPVLARADVERPETEAADEEPVVRPRPVTVEAPPVVPAAAVAPSPVVAPPRVRTIAAPLRPASFSDARVVPHLRTARWQVSTSKVAKIVETSASAEPQELRVAMPTSKAPSPTPTKLLADNFNGDDVRVDEMRSVVDDFRAAMAPDAGSDTESDDSLSAG